MKTFKIDKRFKLYKDNFRYCAEPTTDNDYFSDWKDFCEKQWGSCATSNRWNHSYTKQYIIGYTVIFRFRIFFRNEKDLLWFTLGTSA